MNNAEWIRLLKKQRERDEAMRAKVEEDNKNESIIDNGDGNNNGSDAGNGTGGEDNNPPQSTELGDNSGDIETGSVDNGDAQ